MWFFTFGHFYQSDQFLVIMTDFEDKKLVVNFRVKMTMIKITEDEKLYG